MHVNNTCEIAYVRAEKVVPVCSGDAKRLFEWDPLDTLKSTLEKLIRRCLNPVGNVGFRRPTVWRVVLEAAVVGRIMRWRDHDSVGQSSLSLAVVSQNRVRYHGRRSVFVAFGDHHFDAVGGQHLERTRKRRQRKRMSIHPKKQWTIYVLQFSIQTNCLRDGEDVPLVKSRLKSRTTMS